MKVAVTGANGFLGRGIVAELASRGHEVVAVDMRCDRVEGATRTIERSAFEMEDPYTEMSSPDCVLHLAWRDGFSHNSSAHMEDLPAHVKFIRKLTVSSLSRLAVMGTMHEVGYFEGGIRAETPCMPQSMYGIAKNALRQVANLLATESGTELLWLRGYYIVDNTQYGSSIFSKICQAAAEGKRTFPFTMGQNQYDFLDYGEFCMQVSDIVAGADGSGIYNICSGKPEKLADRVERFIVENELSINLEYGAFPDRPYDSPAVWGHR
ncbi:MULTISPECIES: NAD(P)-dependent oxidoreductase [unclassified Adlercreutzia]|uniref:NAD-dependent epimerase/dehydratase family protein n=1 Tax=unclassified Adlercreutzia TaxID=2636013 RepID=UPI0013EBA345|nr:MULTISPECIES: NAD(P)-dependent oxidoreductase [unclassified Adlercreutzia]